MTHASHSLDLKDTGESADVTVFDGKTEGKMETRIASLISAGI